MSYRHNERRQHKELFNFQNLQILQKEKTWEERWYELTKQESENLNNRLLRNAERIGLTILEILNKHDISKFADLKLRSELSALKTMLEKMVTYEDKKNVQDYLTGICDLYNDGISA